MHLNILVKSGEAVRQASRFKSVFFLLIKIFIVFHESIQSANKNMFICTNLSTLHILQAKHIYSSFSQGVGQ